MLDFIHAERQLSLNHWRYRLLHWSFGLKQGQQQAPDFFYEHYCPLFHMTNILVVLFPLIAIFKTIKFLFLSIVSGIIYLLQKIEEWFPEPVPTNEEILIKVINWYLDHGLSVNSAKSEIKSRELPFTEEEVNKKWKEIKTVRKLHAEQVEADKAARKERMIYFVRMSEILIKAGLSIVYVVSTLLSIWLASKVGLFLGSLFYDLFSLIWEHWYSILTGGTKALMIGLVVFLIGYIFKNALDRFSDKLIVPLKIVVDIFAAFFGFIAKAFSFVIEFFGQVYSDNCPPIKITDE